MDNMCFAMVKPNLFEKEFRNVPNVGEDDALIKIEYCGICGSDVHLLQTGKQGENIASEPMILGHEASGEVIDIGKNVENLSVGDKVAIEPGKVCRICEFCKTGRYNLCPNMVFPSTPPNDGMFIQYVKVPADMAFKLPSNVSTKEGALMEPLSCALNASNQGEIKLGKSVTIIGAGCIGLLTLLACKARGATEIYISDVLDKRLDMAKKLGAKETINVKGEKLDDHIMRYTNGVGVDTVIECSGTQAGMQITPNLIKSGGNIVLVGLPPEDNTEINFTKIIWKEATIKTSFRYRNWFPIALKAISAGFIDVKRIITNEFKLENLQEAFDYVINNSTEVIKAIVKM